MQRTFLQNYKKCLKTKNFRAQIFIFPYYACESVKRRGQKGRGGENDIII